MIMRSKLIDDFRRWLGVDRAIAYAICTRSWGVVSGVVSVFLLATFLRPNEQGYYYTFYSLLGLQLLFELGLASVILTCAGHERAFLSWSSDHTLQGNAQAKRRLASILKLAMRWYALAATLMVIIVLPSGAAFFTAPIRSGKQVAWEGAWIWLVCCTGLNLCLTPLMSVVEGCGLVAEIGLVRLITSITTSCALWAALAGSLGLASTAVVSATSVMCTSIYLVVVRRPFLMDLFRTATPDGDFHFSWWREVWPFQWRIAVSWISGYLALQLFNPILFKVQGPEVAGQMGMSLNVLNGAMSVGLAWISTKAPALAASAARQNYEEMDTLFFSTLKQSGMVLAGITLALIGSVITLQIFHVAYETRLLSPLPFALLAGKVIIDFFVYCLAVYLRAHKREPFIWLSVLGAATVPPMAIVFGKSAGALGVTLGAFGLALLLGLPLAWGIFQRCRREWHVIPIAPSVVVNA